VLPGSFTKKPDEKPNAKDNMPDRVAAVGNILVLLWANKKWWLGPMLGALFIAGVVIVLAHSSVIAPWVFSLF
jgi:hypothetical protein